MRIRRLAIRNFRGVDECEIAFRPDGVTIIEGPNEIGKSSLVEAFNLLLWRRADSSSNDVRSVKPVHRDANPEVEASLELGDYAFVYRKCFGTGRRGETTLEVSQPVPESVSGREAHERVEEILGEALDVSLWDALRFEQGEQILAPALGNSPSLQAALDAAAGGASAGDRASDLYERVRAEYLKYFTEARGQPRQPLVDAGSSVTALESEADDLGRRLAELEGIAAEAERLITEKTRIKESLEAARRDADQREADAEKVRQMKVSLDRLESGSRSAKAETDAIEAKRNSRRELIDAVDELSEAVRHRSDELEDLDVRVGGVKEQREKSQEAFDLARAAAGKARRLVEIRRDDRDYLSRRDDVDDLRRRLSIVHEQQEVIKNARGVLAGNDVDDSALERLKACDHNVALKHVARDAGSAKLVIEAQDETSISINGEPLNLSARDLVDRAVAEEMTVEVPDMLTITVRPGAASEESVRSLQDAEAELAGVLGELEVTDLAEAEAANREWLAARQAVEHAGQRIEDELRGETTDELERRLGEFELFVNTYPVGRPAEPALAEGFEGAFQAFQDAQAEVDEAERTLKAAESARDAAVTQFEELNGQLVEVGARHDEVLANLTRQRDHLAGERESVADADLESEWQSKSEALERAELELSTLSGEYETLQPDVVIAQAGNAGDLVSRLNDDWLATERELTAANATLAAHEAEGLAESLGEIESELDQQRRQWASLSRRAEAAKKLYDVLTDCRDEATRSYRAPLRAKIEDLGKFVFGDTFAVELTDDLAIDRVTRNGLTVPFDDLSVGAKEQLSVLARLAVAMLVEPESGVPVILDDALGYSDPVRLEALGAVIRVVAERRHCQIVLMTCYPERYRFIGSAQVVRLPQAQPHTQLEEIEE